MQIAFCTFVCAIMGICSLSSQPTTDRLGLRVVAPGMLLSDKRCPAQTEGASDSAATFRNRVVASAGAAAVLPPAPMSSVPDLSSASGNAAIVFTPATHGAAAGFAVPAAAAPEASSSL